MIREVYACIISGHETKTIFTKWGNSVFTTSRDYFTSGTSAIMTSYENSIYSFCEWSFSWNLSEMTTSCETTFTLCRRGFAACRGTAAVI